MNSFKQFVVVALALFVGMAGFNAYRDYSDTHILLRSRAILTETGEKADAVQVWVDRTSPFHQAQGIHVYMIPFYQQKDAEGYWQKIPAGDDQVREGYDFVVYPDPGDEEKYSLTWILVCTTEKLTTWKQVEQASWNQYLKNDYWFEAVVFGPVSLQCK